MRKEWRARGGGEWVDSVTEGAVLAEVAQMCLKGESTEWSGGVEV